MGFIAVPAKVLANGASQYTGVAPTDNHYVYIPLNADGSAVRMQDAGNTPSATSFSTGSDIVGVAGSAVQGAALAVTRGVQVCADPSNSGIIYIGDSGVTNASGSKRGIPLVAGGMVNFRLNVSNTNQIYVNCDTSGDRACITVLS